MRASLTAPLESARNIAEYLSRYGHPDFTPWRTYLSDMGRTLAIALWATCLALGGSVLLAPLAAANLSPHPMLHRAARELLSFLRAMPDAVLALLGLSVLGLGPLPGVLAMALHTTGFLGKFCSEGLERVQPGVYEALDACGAGAIQRLVYAGWPSVFGETLGYALYILDRNVRMACVLGIVGAGGIGVALQETIRVFEYGRAAAIVSIVLVSIVCIDYSSSWLRAKVV